MGAFRIIALLLGLATVIHSSELCRDRMNILLPKVVVPGQSTTALVHFHSDDEQHNVTLRLIRPPDKPDDRNARTAVLAQNTVVIRGNGIVSLSIPTQENGVYEIQASLDCTPTDENCSLQTSSKVKLTGFVQDVIIRPSSNYYRPGETIKFWILAIDQTLHAPVSALANLCVKDAKGISVAVWEDVPLFEGTKEFQVPISEKAPLGKWTIQVRSEGNLYTGELNVSLARGSNQLLNREQVVTEKHFVELHFSEEMRRKYKPGLPLIGKVRAVSSEEEVRVRVKVIDDQFTILYSQDIDIDGREGTFYVPAVITNTDSITVQAELISLGRTDVDSQYVLARETLHKWHSESNCYLLIRDLHTDLMPDVDADVTVLTSCPNTGDMHYVVTSEGKMVSWGELVLSNQTNVSVILDSIMQGVNIYEFNISFAVEAQMAPRSHLLVYYTTDSGEIIGDSIGFNVKLLHEKVSLIVDENNVWYEQDTIKVGILSFPKTHICLVGGRSEDVHFSNSEIIDSRRQILDDGISFLTSCRRIEDNFELPKHQSYFPNTILNQAWVWKCFNYTEEIETNGIALPPTNAAGKWKLWAFTMSDAIEFRMSQPATINVFSPVNVDFVLPTTVKVMEIIQVEITIASNINSCIDIHALISLSEGAVYPGIDMSVVSEKLRLGGYGATSIVVRIQPISPGVKTMTANVSCYVRNGCDEAPASAEDPNVKIPITSVIRHSGNLRAVPEGIQKHHTESAYFCANEETISLPAAGMDYEFIPAPKKKYNVVFDAIAEKSLHVVLAEQKSSMKNFYQIYLGDFDNTISWIGRGRHNYEVHLSSAKTPDILSATGYKTFWLNWENSVINIGRGSVIGDGTFLTHIMDKKMRVNYIGFATIWGVDGRIRVSEHNDESGYSQVLRLDVPHNMVAGSEKGSLYVTSGLSLPLVFQQLKIESNSYPFSSLANALSTFTTLSMMDEDAWDSKWLYAIYNRTYIREYTRKNLQALFAYMKDDYSFSDHPKLSDHLSTVRAFEILSRAQYYWKIDAQLLENVKKAILKNQRYDGHFFDETSKTIEDDVVATAETVAVIVETGFEEADREVVYKAEKYLTENIQQINDTYVKSVVCYALQLLNNKLADQLLADLHIPTRSNDEDNNWQSSSQSSIPSSFDWLYKKEKRVSDDKRRILMTSFITDYKASAYTALIHSLRKDLKHAAPIVKYLFYRSAILDQYFEEVSYLAAKTFSKFSSLSKDTHPSLTISLATSGMELTETLELKSEFSPHASDLPSLPTKVFIYATGAGCSTVQSQVSYQTFETTSASSFDFITFIEEEIPAHYNVIGDPEGLYPQLIMKSCLRLDYHSDGVRIEGILFSGYRLDSVLSISPSNIELEHGQIDDKFWFVFANVSADCGICVRYLVQSSFIISSLRPMLFRMYEIRNSQIMQEIFVHSPYRDSLLRTDVNDAHFLTWFGSPNISVGPSQDLTRFYQCPRSNDVSPTVSDKNEIEDVDGNKIIVVDVDDFVDEANSVDYTTNISLKSGTEATSNTTVGTVTLEEPQSVNYSTILTKYDTESPSYTTSDRFVDTKAPVTDTTNQHRRIQDESSTKPRSNESVDATDNSIGTTVTPKFELESVITAAERAAEAKILKRKKFVPSTKHKLKNKVDKRTEVTRNWELPVTGRATLEPSRSVDLFNATTSKINDHKSPTTTTIHHRETVRTSIEPSTRTRNNEPATTTMSATLASISAETSINNTTEMASSTSSSTKFASSLSINPSNRSKQPSRGVTAAIEPTHPTSTAATVRRNGSDDFQTTRRNLSAESASTIDRPEQTTDSSTARHLRKHPLPNKIVIGQNELVFGTQRYDTPIISTTSMPETTRSSQTNDKSTATNSLWGMLREVAYDTRRKSTAAN